MKQKKLTGALAGLGLMSLMVSADVSARYMSNINFGDTALTVELHHRIGCATPPEFTVNVSKTKGENVISVTGDVSSCTGTGFVQKTLVFDYATNGINPSKEYTISNSISFY